MYYDSEADTDSCEDHSEWIGVDIADSELAENEDFDTLMGDEGDEDIYCNV